MYFPAFGRCEFLPACRQVQIRKFVNSRFSASRSHERSSPLAKGRLIFRQTGNDNLTISYQKVQSSVFKVQSSLFTVYFSPLTSHLSPLSPFGKMSAGQKNFFLFFSPGSIA